MGVQINVTITSNLPEYQKELDEVIEKVLTMWGMQGESAAKRLAPVDTGLLRNSITYALAGHGAATTSYKDNAGDKSGTYSGQAESDKENTPRHVHIGSNVEYAIYQELGTSKMKAQPFLRPGIEQNRDYFRQILEGELKKALQS